MDELPPAMNNVVLPHFTVTAVSHCPGGAWPSYAHGHYARDNDFYLKWDSIARDRAPFTAWIDRHVRATLDHRGFLASLAGGRVMPLHMRRARPAGFLLALRRLYALARETPPPGGPTNSRGIHARRAGGVPRASA